MDADIVTSTAHASHADKIPFPEAVENFIAAGVEYYHVNYITLQISYYSNKGSVIFVPVPFENLPRVSEDFRTKELQAAILDSQNNSQSSRDFSARAMKSGVQGYFAFLRGQRVVYIGRQGNVHTEWFPNAKPENT